MITGLGGSGASAPSSTGMVVNLTVDPNVFPVSPILDGVADAVAAAFAADSSVATGGPCLVEPQLGVLLPNSGLRPRFSIMPSSTENVFEIRMSAQSQVNDLLVYTTGLIWTLPADLWKRMSSSVADEPITVSVRGGHWDGSSLSSVASGTSGDFSIAPVTAEGKIVYWRTILAEDRGILKGFQVGNETVVDVLTPEQVVTPIDGMQPRCIGCHVSTPDGSYVGFANEFDGMLDNNWANGIAGIEQGSVGAKPPFLSQGAMQAMGLQDGSVGLMAFSGAHWTAGDHVMVTRKEDVGGAPQLVWIDLEASSSAQGIGFGVFQRNGDPRGPHSPAWSHDGGTIVYTSVNTDPLGWRTDSRGADLYSIPYANRQGGSASTVSGAAEPDRMEYYPAFSPDDRLIAFDVVSGGGGLYDNSRAEVNVIPAQGGSAVRHAANDPPACLGQRSPGLTNSWPKWSPETASVGNRAFYWLTFSSKRTGRPQLFVAGVVVQDGQISTYPAFYLWNQPPDESNHTPAWDMFRVVVPPILY
ncbi:MAG TPA: hypothetical protein VGJ84_09670 [Polyangiaceae bacterium]